MKRYVHAFGQVNNNMIGSMATLQRVWTTPLVVKSLN